MHLKNLKPGQELSKRFRPSMKNPIKQRKREAKGVSHEIASEHAGGFDHTVKASTEPFIVADILIKKT